MNWLNPAAPVLLIDDERPWLRSMSVTLEKNLGINNVILCDDSREVMGMLAERSVSLVLLDVMMPHIKGSELLPQIVEGYPDIPVIIISGLNQVETAVECVKLGAYDYFVKAAEQERLLAGIKRALELKSLQRENRALSSKVLREDVVYHEAFADIVTRNVDMLGIFSYVEAIAGSREPVLVSGESGTGKELMARAIHRLACPDEPWVAVNMGDLDAESFAATLFGHVRGGVPGSVADRRGMLEETAGGILFLDEIGELSLDMQAKLLRLTQSGEFLPLGSDRPKVFHGRIVCSTSRDLEAAVAEGTFRKDLYFRLAAHQVKLPALRERKGDIPLLLEYFLVEVAGEMGKKIPACPEELIPLLQTYHFPGNVRELRSMVYNAVARHKSRILSLDTFRDVVGGGGTKVPVEDSAADPTSFSFGLQLPTITEMTQALVAEALERSGGNQSIAANLLGITRQALNQRLKRQQQEGS